MATWGPISHTGMCVAYSESVYRAPGEHPCNFAETFAGQAYDNQDEQLHPEVRTLRCPLMIYVSEQIDPYASRDASAFTPEPVEVHATAIGYQALDQIESDMGNGCLWGERGQRPRVSQNIQDFTY